MGRFELIYFTADNAWLMHHSMAELLQQEFQRYGFGVIREAPPAELPRPSLHLEILYAGDSRMMGAGRTDQLRHLEVRLSNPTESHKTPTAASYHGISLDRIDQKKLAERIVREMLQESGSDL
ncbi:MAG: hypothetical protein AAF191_08420 [Verrucomicrobiota bacterium]